MPDIPDTRKLVAEHLKFFGELGATGFRKDAAWALRTNGAVPDAGERADGSRLRQGYGGHAEAQSAKAGRQRKIRLQSW